MGQDGANDYPLIISYYAGDKYYYECAKKLKADCEKLGMDYEIVEAPLKKPISWIDACRFKIKFIEQSLNKHKRPVMWVDVDSRMLARPEVLRSSEVDIAYFLRGHNSLQGYDPTRWARTISPVLIYFGYKPTTLAFVQFLQELEAKFQGEATDDYFFQEAWANFDKPLSMILLSEDLVAFGERPKDKAYFEIGLSGNVKTNSTVAKQHSVEFYSPLRRKTVFQREAFELGRRKRNKEALVMMKYALEADPTDEVLAYTFARSLRDRGDMKQALQLLAKLKTGVSDVDHAARFLVDSEMLTGNFNRATNLARKLIEAGSQADKNWALSRLTRLELELRARAQHLRVSERPPLWWIEAPYPGNFGDILNPYIVEKLSGRPPFFASRDQAILAIGSIIKFAMPGTHVWGSGTPRMTDRLNAKANYHAVRGPLTRQLVLESGGQCPEVYGDAAWFLPQIYEPKPTEQKYKLGMIRHYTNDGEVETGEGVLNIPLLRAGYEGIEDFIDELNSCEAILTTSLHGLIVAHAYGIPARWCEVVDAKTHIAGDGTKHHDYMMSVGIEPEPPLELHKDTLITLDWTKEANRLPRKQIDLTALANAAPFEITASWGKANPKMAGKPLQTDAWHGEVAKTAEGDVSKFKEVVSKIDARFLNYSLRKLYGLLK